MTTMTNTGNGIDLLQTKARLGTNFLGAEVVNQLLNIEGVKTVDSEILKDKKVALALVPLLGSHSFFSPAMMSVEKLVKKWNNQTLDETKMLYSIDWYAKEKFFTSEAPNSDGTWIIGREPVEGGLGKNIFVCLSKLVEHAKTHLPLPSCSELFQKNLAFTEQELGDMGAEISQLMREDDPLAIEKIFNLRACKMFLGSFGLLAQFVFIDNRVNNRRLLNGKYIWTKSIPSDARHFVLFGDFVDLGVFVYGSLPGYRWDNQSALFSCRLEELYV